MNWEWFTKFDYNRRFIRNVLLKAFLLFVALNLIYAVVNPLTYLSRLSLYNVVFPGRARFPYADDSSASFNVTLGRLEGLFASHLVNAAEKSEDEYRVFLLGDSSVWGWLLDYDETLSACINAQNHFTRDGRRIVAYNLGYPALSATKDVLILEYALEYSPDAFVWLITLQTLFDNEQLRHPILQENRDIALQFVSDYDLSLEPAVLAPEDDFWARTIVGQRRDLADLFRHQVYGIMWALSHVDHAPTSFLETPMFNLPRSEGILNRGDIEIGTLPDDVVSWDVLSAGVSIASAVQVPVLIVNEPIFISDGLNSDLRYNAYYPRWAYDQYHQELINLAQEENWHLADFWSAVPPEDFTDTPFHYTASATCEFANRLAAEIVEMAD